MSMELHTLSMLMEYRGRNRLDCCPSRGSLSRYAFLLPRWPFICICIKETQTQSPQSGRRFGVDTDTPPP